MSRTSCRRTGCLNPLPPYCGRGRPKEYCTKECRRLAEQVAFFDRMASEGKSDALYWRLQKFGSRRVDNVSLDESGNQAYVWQLNKRESALADLADGPHERSSPPIPLPDVFDLVVRAFAPDGQVRMVRARNMIAEAKPNITERAQHDPKPEHASHNLHAGAALKFRLVYARLVAALRRALADEPSYQEALRRESTLPVPVTPMVFCPATVLDNGDVIVRFPLGNYTLAEVRWSRDGWARLTGHRYQSC